MMRIDYPLVAKDKKNHSLKKDNTYIKVYQRISRTDMFLLYNETREG